MVHRAAVSGRAGKRIDQESRSTRSAALISVAGMTPTIHYAFLPPTDHQNRPASTA